MIKFIPYHVSDFPIKESSPLMEKIEKEVVSNDSSLKGDFNYKEKTFTILRKNPFFRRNPFTLFIKGKCLNGQLRVECHFNLLPVLVFLLPLVFFFISLFITKSVSELSDYKDFITENNIKEYLEKELYSEKESRISFNELFFAIFPYIAIVVLYNFELNYILKKLKEIIT